MSEASETKKRNRLAGETSPYLLQHASNPVDWYPWGEEALCRAKDLDRPIFLSIGYSSCHWCHVMERESFENPEIAGVLNEHFINIKVDREERPDIDAIYMTAVQMMTGTGGWPLSVFLTPELKPFWGGTYFPPESRYGRPGFEDILRSIAGGYREQREKLEEFASELTGWIRKEERSAASAELPGEDSLKAVVSHADQTFDAHNGGFGAAPKFPRPIEISNLLRYHCRAREARILHMCEKTLEAMAHGGIYDQVGGGFHRYSTDERWIVPHFEKMLYDNALLARTYLEAFQSTGNDAYARIAREVLDYVLREMTSPEGGFYSATDADSEGEEGKFFVWTPDQVEAVLGKDDARIVCEWFNITPGGNFEHRTSIPHVTRSVEDVAKSLNISPGTVRETVKRGRDALYRARQQRAKPFRDEKVLTCWNGLMISAFVKGFQVTEEPRYLDAARRAADLILAKLWIDGRLHRTYKDGKARIAAFLDDHAYLGEALLDLYEATFQPEYLERARDMMDFLLAHFWDEGGGGFFFAGDHQESLISRKRDDLDSSTPSGNGVAALNLLRLERLTGVAAYRDRAERLFRSVKGLLDRFAAACGSTVLAVDFYMGPPVEIVLIGDLAGAAGRDLLRAVHRSFLPNRVIAGAVEPIPESLWRTVPLLEGKKTVDGVPTAYVCRDRACGAPVTTPEALRAQLDSAR